MSKRNRLKKQVASQVEGKPAVGLMLGQHQFRAFEGIDAAFGARLSDYPQMSDVPEAFQSHNGPYQNVVSALFFRGGGLSDFGLSFKKGLDHAQAATAIRSLLCSWDPKHEHKTAVVSWALSEWCDGTPTAA